MKVISDSYLYKVTDYNKEIFKYLMEADRVDKNDSSFQDIVYAVKQQATSVLLKVLLSNKVVLMVRENGISRAFKVIYVKDIKEDKDVKKVFIDCSGIISIENGVYKCKKVGVLISYLTAAMTYIIYYNNPKLITGSVTLMKNGAGAFADMMLYVFGYLKVPITYADNKERMSFVLAEYYLLCVEGVAPGETIYNVAKQISGIKDKKICDYLHTLFSFTFEDGAADFNQFLMKFAEVFLDQKEGSISPKNRAKLTVDSFVQRWMYAYGPSTFLGLECFVPFSQILTDCYNGAFINQQNTIEKVAGSKTVLNFTNELLRIGGENA